MEERGKEARPASRSVGDQPTGAGKCFPRAVCRGCDDTTGPVSGCTRFLEREKEAHPGAGPVTDHHIARRKPDELSSEERQNLVQWGYPYVFDAFRFHMTLTGRVPADHAPVMEQVLLRQFAGFHGRPLAVSGLALFREPSRGADFTVHSLFPFAGSANRKIA